MGKYQFGSDGPRFNGVPLIGASTVPMIMNANYYYVDGMYGSDGNKGIDASKPFATIAKAITTVNARIGWSNTRWATGDVIVIAPGVYAENLTTLPYGATMVGLGDAFDLNGQRGVTIKPTTGSAVDVTSCINTRIHNICFGSADTEAIFQADNLNRCVISHCLFSGNPGASPTTTIGLEVVKDMTGTRISDCTVLVCNIGFKFVADNANSKQITGDIIERCIITGCDTAGIYFDANCVPSMTQITDCIVNGGGATLALAIDDNSAAVHIQNCTFEATACDPASASGHYNNCYLNGVLMT